MMLGAGQTLTPVKDTITLGDGHIHSYAATGPLPHLAAFPVESMAFDDSHLFLWTVARYLPFSLDLIGKWGFRYVLPMVWHKPGGFQPLGLPQFNCELVLYARRGSPEFVSTKAFPCCFEATRREHSRKPAEFYDMIRRVTDGPRIEVFSREQREGFEQFGNEPRKFAEVMS